jgi:malonate-semialdehyde dehydrogenase (acetylating) / methylmalonate-semialdehyde dehydrogenase
MASLASMPINFKLRHGPDAVRFYTKTKTVTCRWPSGVKNGASFDIPTMT